MVARGERRASLRPPSSRHAGSKSKDLRVASSSGKKSKVASIKNQIRSIQRLLAKPLSLEVKEAKEQHLEELRKQAALHKRSELERKMAVRYHKVKFFERRKIERSIRRLEKLQKEAEERTGEDSAKQIADIAEQLADLKEDLEYVRFFPKTEKYVSLFVGNDDETVVAKRQKLREQIKANLAASAAAAVTASAVELEETGNEDVGAVDMSEDDFFLAESLDGSDADDEWTDKSSRSGNHKGSSKPHENRQQHKKRLNVVHVHNHESTHSFRSHRFTDSIKQGLSMLKKNDNVKARSLSSSSRKPNVVHKSCSSNHSANNNSSSNDVSTLVNIDSSNSEKPQKRHRKRRPKKKK